jgi:ATP-dependent Clp protease ATP-binding subunit ClpA
LQQTKPRSILCAFKHRVRGFAAERQVVSQAPFLSGRNSMRGYNFTQPLRRSLQAAFQEASALRHDSVGPEHILLGLASSEDETLLQIWSRVGIDPADIRRDTLAGLPNGQTEHNVSVLPYTASAKRVLELAMAEASVLKDEDGVGPTHVLLGITRLGDEVAARVLRDRGITTDQIRNALGGLRGQPLAELAVVSIQIKIQLRDGAVIQQTFSGGDAEVLQFVSAYLLP